MQKLIGILIVLTSTFLYAIFNPFLKKVGTDIKPFTSMAISMFMLFTCSLFMAVVFENGLSFKFSENKGSVAILLFLGFLNTIAFWLVIVAFKYMPLWQQSLFSLLTPVITAVCAYFLLGETLSVKFFIALAFMSVGLFIAVR